MKVGTCIKFRATSIHVLLRQVAGSICIKIYGGKWVCVRELEHKLQLDTYQRKFMYFNMRRFSAGRKIYEQKTTE